MPALVNLPPRYVDFPTLAEEREARDLERREAIAAQLNRAHEILTDTAILLDRDADSLRGADAHSPDEWAKAVAECHALFSKLWRMAGTPDARARALITSDPMEAVDLRDVFPEARL